MRGRQGDDRTGDAAIWPFYAVMFGVLMLVTYLPAISLWLPQHVLR
jgi:TRAP-type C4-dicarboxylate transport system permease large subunit